MNPFQFRIARPSDIPFLAETIFYAESSGTHQNTYAQIFGLSLPETTNLFSQLLESDCEDCEFALEAYLIAETIDKETVAACAGWIEAKEGISSNALKSMMLSHFLGTHAWSAAKKNLELFSTVNIEREHGCLQLDEFYVKPAFRGQGIVQLLIEKQISRFLTDFPEIAKAQIILVKENHAALRAYLKAGFHVTLQTHSDNIRLAEVLGGTGKVLVERYFTKQMP